MTQVTRKNNQEALENLIRRFNRKVLQSGMLSLIRKKQYFEKEASKRTLRISAIKKKQRRDERMRRLYFGK